MAHLHLAQTSARFAARVHRTKNRLVAIPAAEQRRLGLERQPDNCIALVSLRRCGRGRWNHHYVKLTFDNEFAIPSDVAGIRPGDEVEVKVHRLIRDEPMAVGPAARGAALLLALAREPRARWREDGAERLDEYLREGVRGE
jgi:hypothetical protein